MLSTQQPPPLNQPQRLNDTKAKLLVIENRLRKLAWEHEVLEQRFQQSKSERDQMRDEYEKTIYNVKQKSGFDNQLIRKKIAAVNDDLERHDAQLREVRVDPILKYRKSYLLICVSYAAHHCM